MRQRATSLRPSRGYFLLVGLLVVALYVLVPQLGDFRSSWHLLRHPLPGWTAAAIGLTALTYLAAAATYWWLALKPLRYGQMVLVQLAAMFVNRLLPAGLGALGTNYAYLRHSRHSPAQAASVVAINNLLGGLGHGLLVVVTLAAFSGRTVILPIHDHYGDWLAPIIIGVGLLLIMAASLGRQRFKRWVDDILEQLLNYRQRPWKLPAALLSSMALTLCNVLCLLCCGVALGVHLPFVVILLIFSFGLGAGTATPTPGGLGGFEAGLAAGFIAYHVAGPLALATALLYRLVSYWLPLVAGAPAFVICQRRHLLAAQAKS
jgi:uncharacterized membrane protein YbhN (UPF0104 family)